jgi:hypothetical protein
MDRPAAAPLSEASHNPPRSRSRCICVAAEWVASAKPLNSPQTIQTLKSEVKDQPEIFSAQGEEGSGQAGVRGR